MEKRGIVDASTPDVADRLVKSAKTQTTATKVAVLDDDITRRLADKAAEQLKTCRQQ